MLYSPNLLFITIHHLPDYWSLCLPSLVIWSTYLSFDILPIKELYTTVGNTVLVLLYCINVLCYCIVLLYCVIVLPATAFTHLCNLARY